MLADYHVHTYYSDDSFYPMEEVIKDAIALNIDELCFTDHVDYGTKPDIEKGAAIYCRDGKPHTNVDYQRYVKEVAELRAKYADKISIKLGLEFGMQVHTIEKYERLFKKYPFDFIILSVHEIDDLELYTGDFQRDLTQKEYNERYYNELLKLVKNYKNYSILGHLDLAIRYDKYGVYPFEKVKPIITEILKTAIADGKGIEVNTSSHRYGINGLTPSADILKLYLELGGEIITLGSDSHKKEHLGAYLEETKQILRDMGFKSFCTYDKMKPIFHDL